MVPSGSREKWWRLLGWTFLAGAVLDLAFGVGALAAQERLAPVLGIRLPPPGQRVYLDLSGLLLVGLGVIYIQIFRDPRRGAPVAAAATLLRFGGFALFYGDVLAGRGDPFFKAVGSVDAVLALVQLGLLRAAAGSLTDALLGRERQG